MRNAEIFLLYLYIIKTGTVDYDFFYKKDKCPRYRLTFSPISDIILYSNYSISNIKLKEAQSVEEVMQEHIERFDEIIHAILKHYKDYTDEICALYPQGITSTELSIIKVVCSKPEIILKEVSESLAVPGSTLTSAIDRLEHKNLLERVISRKNRHSFGLKLTDDGIKLNALHEEAERRIWRRILSQLTSDEERESLITLLGKIVSGVDTMLTDVSKQQEKRSMV